MSQLSDIEAPAMRTVTKSRPIIFTAESVRAIIAGAKTMTRRVIKPQPTRAPVINPGFDARGRMTFSEGWHWDPTVNDHHIWRDDENPNSGDWAPWFMAMCPYGVRGERLWVREPIRFSIEHDNAYYVADDKGVGNAAYAGLAKVRMRGYKIVTPYGRIASRLTLEITDVRVERVQDISEADARAEGASESIVIPGDRGSFIPAFRETWDAINAKRGFSFESNPFCWAISFNVLK